MSYIDLLSRLKNLKEDIENREFLVPGVDSVVQISEMRILLDLLQNILSDLLLIMVDVAIDGKPYPVDGLVNTERLETQADFIWNEAIGGNIQGYRVYRRDGEEDPWLQVGSDIPFGTTEFSDTTIIGDHRYRYIVRAYNGNGESRDSDEICILEYTP